jgi:RNA recognition motif-containing protein
LVKDGSVSKGYCFFEYEDNNCSDKAIKALNSFPIADKRLKCHAATLGNKGLSLSFTPTNQNNVGLR